MTPREMKHLISQNHLKEAMVAILKNAEMACTEQYNRAVLLSARLNNLLNQELEGILRTKQLQRKKLKITRQMLYFIDCLAESS